MTASKILFFVEDPGAALFIGGLPAALSNAGIAPVVCAIRHAAAYFQSVEAIPEAGEGNFAAADALLDRIGAAAVVVGTSEDPDSFAFPIIEAARQRGLPTVGAVDSAANSGNRLRGRTDNPLAHSPDWLLVADRRTADGFVSHGFDTKHIRICGHPRLHEIDTIGRSWTETDRQAHRRKWFPDALNRRIIVFVSELSVGLGHNPFLRTDEYQLSGTTNRVKRTDIVMEELLLAARSLHDDPYMALRLHPKQRLEDELYNIALFDQVSHIEPGLEIVHAADLVVGMTSILLVEAATLGRPVLSIVPVASEREWLGDIGAAIPCVSTRDEIAAWLNRDKGSDWPSVPNINSHRDPIVAMTKFLRSLLSDRAG